MRLGLMAFLSVFLAGPVSVAQVSRMVLRPIQVSPQVVEAQQRVTVARTDLIRAREIAAQAQAKAETDKSPAAQADLQKAQEQVAAAQNNAAQAQATAKQLQSEPVTEQQWGQLRMVLRDAHDRFAKSMNEYSSLATGLVLAGIVLGVVSAIAGLGKKAMLAGVVSILVTAVIGVPKVFPVNERAAYYRVLFNQSSALLLQAQLRLNPTVADYNDFVRKIGVLSDYETNKFPAGGDVATNTENMIKDIETANGH